MTARTTLLATLLAAVVPLLGLTGGTAPAQALAVGTPGSVRAVQTVTDPSMRLTVYWGSARNATRYRLYVSASPTMSSPRVITTSSRKAVVGRLSAARSYCIRVRGLRGSTYGPASATRCTAARPGAAWMSGQALQSTAAGVRTTLTVRWARAAGATRYDVDYALSPDDKLVDIQASRSKRTLTVRGTSASLQAVKVPGLAPGRVYCFQLRSRGTAGNSPRSARHCKMTMRASRVVPTAPVPLAVATFNTCSNACAEELGPWSQRAAPALERVLAMRTGASDRPIDVLAVQEGLYATSQFETDLDGTFTKACATSGRLQSVFVRDATWEVVQGSAGSMIFTTSGYRTHGACWAKIRDVATGLEVVVVGLHLYHLTDGDAERQRETDALADAVTAAYPSTPVVYAGDFNSHRTRAVDGPRLRLAQDGLDDAYDQAALYASVPYRNSGCGQVCLDGRKVMTSVVWGDHIDRVFAPAGAYVASWQLDHRMDGTRYAAPLLSDHNPVVVELQLRGPA